MITTVPQDNGCAELWNFIVAKLFSSFALLLPLQDRFPPLLQIPASKKNTTIRQAIICPVLSSAQ